MNNLDEESRMFLIDLVGQYNIFLHRRAGVDEEDVCPLDLAKFTAVDQLRVAAALGMAVQATNPNGMSVSLEELVPALDEEQLQWLDNAPQLWQLVGPRRSDFKLSELEVDRSDIELVDVDCGLSELDVDETRHERI